MAEDQSCEVIVVGVVDNETQEAIMAASHFLPADDFLDTVYDNTEGHLKTMNDLPIRAVMCERQNIIPTLRDVPLLQTGLSLTLSQDFNAAESGLLTIYDGGEDYKAEYSGPPLSEAQEAELTEMLKIFDLQRLVKNESVKDSETKPTPEILQEK